MNDINVFDAIKLVTTFVTEHLIESMGSFARTDCNIDLFEHKSIEMMIDSFFVLELPNDWQFQLACLWNMVHIDYPMQKYILVQLRSTIS